MPPATLEPVTQTRKFRVNFGSYEHSDKIVYGPGQKGGPVVESSEDLVQIYGREKFSYLEDTQVVQNRPIGDDGLASLDVEKLRAFATKESIDLEGMDDKDAIVRRIRAHIYDLSDITS